MYKLSCLQFGQNAHVPGHNSDLLLSNSGAVPIDVELVDPATGTLWCLIFTYDGNNFYTAGTSVPPKDGAVYKAWYAVCGGKGHAMAFTPFVIGSPAAGEFITASNFVDFSVPATGNSVNMDTVAATSVTATVHNSIPELEKTEFATHSTSQSIIITTRQTQVVFDHFFVYGGDPSPAVKNSITAQKGHSCLALTVFRHQVSEISKEISTTMFPKIPASEWPMLIGEAVKDIGPAGLLQYANQRTLTAAGPSTVKAAIESIAIRTEAMARYKSALGAMVK